MPAAEQMHMNVEYGLSGFGIGVHNKPEAARINISFFCNFYCRFVHAKERFFVSRGKFKDSRDVLSRYYQDVNRRFWLDILKSHHKLVFINYFAGYLLARYFAEDTAYHSPAFSSLGGF